MSPAVSVPPHAIVLPPFASCICVLAPVSLIAEPIRVLPLVIDPVHETLLGYAASGRAASAATAASRRLRAAIASYVFTVTSRLPPVFEFSRL